MTDGPEVTYDIATGRWGCYGVYSTQLEWTHHNFRLPEKAPLLALAPTLLSLPGVCAVRVVTYHDGREVQR